MNNLDDIYDKALTMLKNGRSKQEVLLEFKASGKELAPLLEVGSSLLSLAKNDIPQPAMRRKYVLAPGKNFWLTWLHVSKFAGISVSLMLLLSAFALAGYNAAYSAPGQALFAVKKTAQHLQVLLASNDTAKANLQIAIAQQRLSQAQQIFSDPSSNSEQKQAALNELAGQTSSAVASVSTIVQSNPKSSSASPFLSSLESINKQQQNLLAAIKPDTSADIAPSGTLETLTQTSDQISQIKQLVAIASDNQTLTTLNANPNSVAVLGNINGISGSEITVEKTTFVFNSKTSITDIKGNNLNFNDLHQNDKVNIIGYTDQNNLYAQSIFVTSAGQQPEVKGASTQTPAGSLASATGTAATAAVLKKPSNEAGIVATEDNATSTKDSDTATGLFILESPSPQFVPNQ